MKQNVRLRFRSTDVLSILWSEAAKIVEEGSAGFIDINFGCPVKRVDQKGAGAGMLKDIPLMVEMTRQIVQAVKIPVTAKPV